ncbi:MAG: type VI secretion system baseplate subunit TssK [Thermodesulfobacteriota bacterium]|nr:type VI secretion system baseplate subunit TssK [Thermodesulfobacteriota bacterium]
MTANRPIFWHQGLFLQPQHFQHLETYFRSLLSPLHDYPLPYFWGVDNLKIHKASLNNQVVDISSGSFIFQDNTAVNFPGNAFLQSRTFDVSWLEGDKTLDVYLGLKKFDPAGMNVSVIDNPEAAKAATTRFVSLSSPDSVSDCYSDGPDALLKTMRYVLKLFWENEVEELTDYHLIPLARLVHNGQEIDLSPRFVPPALTIAGSPMLLKTAKSVRDQIVSRCKQLEEFKSPKEMQTSGFDPEYMIYLLALRSLNRFAPYLSHLMETPNIHPWLFYGVMREIVGDLSMFSNRINVMGELPDGTPLMPPYNHDDPGECFTEAQTLISELLNDIIIGPEHIIHLEKTEDGFQGDVPPDALDRRNAFYLVIRTETDEAGILNALSNTAKLASAEKINMLVSRALPAIPLTQTKVPPPGLPRRMNSLYFLIDREHHLWEDIQRSGTIHFYWVAPPPDMDVEIVILRNE